MQFEDPKSAFEAAAAKPSRELDPTALVKRGARLRRARLGAAAAGLAVVVAGASASFGLLGADRRDRVQMAHDGSIECDEDAKGATIFLERDALAAEVDALETALLQDPGVTRVERASGEETYAELARLVDERPAWLQDVPPSALAGSFEVTVVDAAALEAIRRIDSPAVEMVLPVRELSCLAQGLCDRPPSLDAAIFLKGSATPDEIEVLRRKLASSDDVATFEYRSRRDTYRELLALRRDDPALYDDISPRSLPASFRVTAVDEAALESVARLASPAIDEVATFGSSRAKICPGDDPPTPRETSPDDEPEQPAHGRGPNVEIKTPYAVPPPLIGPALGELAHQLQMSVDEAECNASPTWAGAPAPEPGRRWCRFRATISNLSEIPLTFAASDQRLQTSDAVVRPSPRSGWSDRPIAPGETRSGDLVYGVAEGADMEFLTLSAPGIAGSARPGAFGCGRMLETDGLVCSYASERALVGSRYRRSVELYHCGVEPFTFAGRRWVADPPPFDATNAPSDFTGEGRIELVREWEARYVDSSGAEIELRADWEWEPPPCA